MNGNLFHGLVDLDMWSMKNLLYIKRRNAQIRFSEMQYPTSDKFKINFVLYIAMY